MTISAEMVKKLREKTGAGLMNCKRAIEDSGGNTEKAIDILRQRGFATAVKKVGRITAEGMIGSYIHMDKIGVLVEVNCETDFVARTDDFKCLARDIAMHIAATNPRYISSKDVSQETVTREKDIYRAQVADKSPQIIEKIAEGKLEKFFADTCLLEQIFIKDQEQKLKIKDLIAEKVAKLGENIVVNKFVRFQVGEKGENV